jgi:hypothetical protein
MLIWCIKIGIVWSNLELTEKRKVYCAYQKWEWPLRGDLSQGYRSRGSLWETFSLKLSIVIVTVILIFLNVFFLSFYVNPILHLPDNFWYLSSFKNIATRQLYAFEWRTFMIDIRSIQSYFIEISTKTLKILKHPDTCVYVIDTWYLLLMPEEWWNTKCMKIGNHYVPQT